jgi:hypothetical protein
MRLSIGNFPNGEAIMGDSKQRTQEEQAAYDQGVADAEAKNVARIKEAADESKPAAPKHTDLDYTGPLTGDQAMDRHRLFGPLAHRNEITKPAANPQTKGGAVQTKPLNPPK